MREVVILCTRIPENSGRVNEFELLKDFIEHSFFSRSDKEWILEIEFSKNASH
jgi:hypothetical protein